MTETKRQDDAADEAFIERFGRAVEAIRADAGGRWGITGEIACPNCGGRLCYSVAGYNGHIWARCETPLCVGFIQ